MKVKNMNEYFREKDTVDLTLLKEIGINLCGRDIIEEYDEKKGENIYKWQPNDMPWWRYWR